MNLLERASGFAIRHLSLERVEALRETYLGLRARLAPLQRWVYGTFDTAALRRHLEQRVGRDFDILMVHSSVNHMRPMYTGDALEMVRMLMDYCGPDRTLAMPAFYFGDPDVGGVIDTFRKKPRFDLRRTPSQMGLATELFRRMPGVMSSRHPVYRIAAIGPLAAPLTRGHELADGPAGRGSPFEFMANHDTCIIGLGKPMQVLTQAHHAEGILGDAFPLPWQVGEDVEMVLIDGKDEVPFRLPNRQVAGHFDIWKLRTILAPGTVEEWTLHHVPLFSTRARPVTDQLIAAAQAGVTLYDPL